MRLSERQCLKWEEALQAQLKSFRQRFIQSIGQECLDRFIVFGEKHMDHLCAEYLAYYHQQRPHQSLDNEPLNRPKARGLPATEKAASLGDG